jgi:hypothetical protein
LANDWQRRIWWPCSTKYRTAKASFKMSPEAKPWYAYLVSTVISWEGRGRTMSKKGKCFFSLQISESSFHCSSVGSTPVGFWSSVLLALAGYDTYMSTGV